MRSTISSTTAPIIDHIIIYIMVTVIGAASVQASGDTPVTAFAMCQQIVVVAAWLSTHLATADGSGIAVLRTRAIVRMPGLIQCFTNQRMLQGQSLAATTGESLVNGPRNGAVIHNGMVVACHSHTVQST